MLEGWSKVMVWSTVAGQFLFGTIAVAALLQLLWRHKPRWSHLATEYEKKRMVPDQLLLAAGLNRQSPSFMLRQTLLSGAGFLFDAAWYMLARRLVTLLSVFVFLTGLLPAAESIWRINWSVAVYALTLGMWAASWWDQPWLEAMRRYRKQRIMQEIYMISNQLLYLAGSSLHLHTKLTRCLPYARTIRDDLAQLLSEWYYDADEALRLFKERLGTEEGLSFAETLHSLRLHEDPAYYELLRERIADYKEKLELNKESRKESFSYVLFMLAGLPILYMFQIFIYPWVQEGQKLFQTLGN